MISFVIRKKNPCFKDDIEWVNKMTTRKRNNRNFLAQPFVKWAGGKRQLLPYIEKYRPKKGFNNYFEPFVGGGALLFSLQPDKAVINDFNTELINTYQVIKNDVDALINDLEKHENTSDYFYEMREKDRSPEYSSMSRIEKASRLIYLNKTCYNGLFRVNSKNQFNVPFGNYKNPNIVNADVLRGVSTYLNEADVKILNGDFEKAVEDCKAGDFVYFDPPYDFVREDSGSFVGYTLNGFNRDEQQRLCNVFKELDKRGCYVLLSNARTEFIEEIYADFNIEIVKASRNNNRKGNGRGKVDEVLVMNYEVT